MKKTRIGLNMLGSDHSHKTIAGEYNQWPGLMDWSTGLTFYLEIDQCHLLCV